jgi:hypothetical protein
MNSFYSNKFADMVCYYKELTLLSSIPDSSQIAVIQDVDILAYFDRCFPL